MRHGNTNLHIHRMTGSALCFSNTNTASIIWIVLKMTRCNTEELLIISCVSEKEQNASTHIIATTKPADSRSTLPKPRTALSSSPPTITTAGWPWSRSSLCRARSSHHLINYLFWDWRSGKLWKGEGVSGCILPFFHNSISMHHSPLTVTFSLFVATGKIQHHQRRCAMLSQFLSPLIAHII